MSTPSPSSSKPASAASATASSPPAADGDYDSALRDVLGSDEGHVGAHNPAQDDRVGEDEDDFGEFVYSGTDAVQPVERPYDERFKRVLGSDDDGDDDESPALQNSRFRPPRVPRPVSDRAVSAHEQLMDRARLRSQASDDSRDASTDAFPGLVTPAKSGDSLASSAFPRRPAAHPQISRLRSVSAQVKHQHHQGRILSVSTQSAFDQRRPPGSIASSALDIHSRRSSVASHLHELPTPSDLLSTTSSQGPTSSTAHISSETFKWSPLRRISTRIYPPAALGGGTGFTPAGATQAALMGHPTVIAVSGVIAVGTSKGWLMVFDFGQNLRCVCGTEAIGEASLWTGTTFPSGPLTRTEAIQPRRRDL